MKRFRKAPALLLVVVLLVSFGGPLASFPQNAEAAFSAVAHRGTFTSATGNATSYGVSPSQAIAAGSVLLLTVVTDNQTGVDGCNGSGWTVSDTDGNTWNEVFRCIETDGSANDGVAVALFWAIATAEIGTGDTVTVDFGVARSDVIISFIEATVGAGSTIAVEDFSGSPASLSASLSGLPSREYLLLGLAGSEGEDTLKTPDSDYTELVDAISGTNGADAANVAGHVQYRIATLTADTVTSADWTNTNPIQTLTAIYEVPPSAPTVATNAESAVTASTATLNGNITSTGGANANERGFAWGTETNLSGGNTATTSSFGDFGAGPFSQALSELDESTTYYFRAFAANSIGTSTGEILNFTTPSGSLSVQGTLYSDEGSTSIDTGKTINLAVGTSSPASIHTTTSNGSGAFSFPLKVNQMGIGVPLLLWVDDGTTTYGATLTKASSTDAASAITGLNIYKDRLILRHEATSATSTTNADLNVWDNGDDPQIQFTSDGTNLETFAGQKIYIWDGDTYAPGGTVTTHGNASASPDGDFQISDGSTFTAGGAISIAGNLTLGSGSTFTASSNTVTFTATTTGKTISSGFVGSAAFADVVFDGVGGTGGGWTLSGNASTTALTITDGTLDISGRLLTAGGTFTQGSTLTTDGTSRIYFTGSGNIAGTLTGTSALGDVEFLASRTFTANASTTDFIIQSGTVTAPSSGLLTVAGDFTNSGTYTNNSATLYLESNSAQALSGTLTNTSALGNITFLGSGTKTFGASASTTNFTIQSGSTVAGPSGGILSFSGVYDNSLGGTFTQNSSAQIFSSGSSIQSGSALTNTNALGNVTFEQSLTLPNASTTGITIANGVTLTAPSSGLLTVAGDFTNSGTYTNNSATLYLESNSAQALSGTLTNTSALGNITFLGSGTKTFGASASTTNFTIQSGSTVAGPSGGILSFAGVYDNSLGGTFTQNSSAQIFSSGSSIQSGSALTNTNALGNVTFEQSLTLPNASTTGITIASGVTLTAPSSGLLTVAGDFTNSGTYTNNSATLYLESNSAQALSGTLTNTSALGNITFLGSGTKTFGASASTTNFTIGTSATVSVSNILTISGAYNNANGGTFSGAGSTLYFGTGASIQAGSAMTGTSAFGGVVFIESIDFGSDNASTTAFTIQSGATVTAPPLLTVAGDYTNNGSFTDSSGTVFFNGVLSLNGTMNTATTDFADAVFIGAGPKTLFANASTTALTISAGTLDISGRLLTAGGTFTNNSTLTTDASSRIYFTGSGNIAGTLTGTSQLRDVEFLASRTFTANASTTDFVITNGTVTAPSSGLLTIAGLYDNANGGTFTNNSSTLYFDTGASIQAGSVLTGTSAFGNVDFLASLTLPVNASTTALTISAGTLDISGRLLTAGGTFTNNSILTTDGTSRIYFTGSGNIAGTLTGTSQLRDVEFLASRTFTANASTTDFVIQSGTVTAPSGLLSVAGNYTNSGTFDANSGTTTANGTSQQTFSGALTGTSAFANLEVINTSGEGDSSQSIIFSSAASTTGTFTLTASTSVQFLANATSTFQNINWNGAANNTRVWLRSSSPGTSWGLDVPGTQVSVQYVDVEDSHACSGNPNIDAGAGSVNVNNNLCWDFLGITISSAANQSFTVGGSSTAAQNITIVEGASGSATASNDIRILIATSTVEMFWDTSVTSVTVSGTAVDNGKVSSSAAVSYEGDNSVATIAVDADLSANETLIISGLKFTNFTSANAAATALSVRTGGIADAVDDATDDKTVSISGSLSASSHTLGQRGNSFSTNTGSLTDAPIFHFRLAPSGEDITVSEMVVDISDASGFSTGNITNTRLYIDYDGDGVVDAGDTQVGGSGAVSLPGATGSITFSTSFTATTTRNYVLTANIASIGPGDTLTFILTPSSNITSSGVTSGASITVTGNVLTATHARLVSQGGGGAIGGAAPAGAGVQSGGNTTGGEEIGSEPGFFAPTANTSASGWAVGFTNPNNAHTSDGSYATTDALAATDYTTFNFSIPGTDTIVGIVVKIEADASSAAGSIGAELSWNGGTATTTTANSTGVLTTSDVVYELGGPSNTWGRSWTVSEFSNANFRLRIIGSPSSNTVEVDAIQVRVYHQAEGGGGGGGGEI